MKKCATIFERRTIRRFRPGAIPRPELENLIDSARCAPCAGNQQRLRFAVVETPELVHRIFDQTAWAALVKPRRNPEWGKNAPSCFIAVLAQAEQSQLPLINADAGAAIQNILLEAHANGLGACWLGAFNRAEVQKILQLPPEQAVIYLVALGYPDETPIMEDAPNPQQVAYYLDEQDQLHVPKISRAQISYFV